MVGIINYGLGNLGSIQNMLKVIGEKSVISEDLEVLEKCDRYILPGVGAFDAGATRLKETCIDEFIRQKALVDKKPLLGICLGMQLLGRKSEEGVLSGLNLIPFDNVRFKLDDTELRVPHMGWDVVDIKQKSKLFNNDLDKQRFYFVHSYHAVCDREEHILLTCDYGYEFTAAVIKENIVGVQFHPEKSHDFGMTLLKNFVREF